MHQAASALLQSPPRPAATSVMVSSASSTIRRDDAALDRHRDHGLRVVDHFAQARVGAVGSPAAAMPSSGRCASARVSTEQAPALMACAPGGSGVDLGVGAVRRDDEAERVLQPVALLGQHLGLVLVDDAGDVPRRDLGQVAVGQAHDLVVGDRGLAAVAAAARRRQAHADDVDAPVLAGADLLLQRARRPRTGGCSRRRRPAPPCARPGRSRVAGTSSCSPRGRARRWRGCACRALPSAGWSRRSGAAGWSPRR